MQLSFVSAVSQRLFVEEHAIIVPLTVQEILEEQIGMKLV